MSDANDPRPWFRPKDIGVGWTPVTWQGWLVTLVFVLVFAATAQLVLPVRARQAAAFPWLAGLRHRLGLSDAGLGLAGSVAAVGAEIALFLLVAWWTSRPFKPLD